MTERYAVAYIRRSTADENGNRGDVSREAQESAVRELARRDGCEDGLKVYTDWGKSADEAKEAARKEYGRMLAAVERGEVSTVYAFSLDRLARSVVTFGRLLRATKERSVRIVTQREGDLSDTGNVAAWGYGFLASFFAEFELRTAKDRNQKALTVRRARGDALGPVPYGSKIVRDAQGRAEHPVRWEDDPDRPLAPVLEAYKAAGTVYAACKLLDAAGVPTPRGNKEDDGNPKVWNTTSLTKILDRAGLLPPHEHRRVYARSAVLAGLLRCHCQSRTLTPDTARGVYYCARGKHEGTARHGRSFVAEAALLPLVKEEMTHFDPGGPYSFAETHEAERAAFLERRRRLAILFADGLMTDDAYHEELAAIAGSLDDLGDAASIVVVPGIDWTAPVGDINEALRAILARIELDAALLPKPDGFVWRVPGMRRP
ncbi:MAG: recombinase family protein [Candidatus Limnocylindrales bacterium]